MSKDKKVELINKAKKVRTTYGMYYNIVEYEYRGYKYKVEYANGSSYCVSDPRAQHECEQARIDQMIESKKRNETKQLCSTVDEALDMLYDYFES